MERAREIVSAKLALVQKGMQLDVVGREPGRMETGPGTFKTDRRPLCDLGQVICTS